MGAKLKLDGIIKPQGCEVTTELGNFNSFSFSGNDNQGRLIEVTIFERNSDNEIKKAVGDGTMKFKITIEQIEE